MQQQSKVIIADTSCFILLNKITSLDILFELSAERTTTKEVQDEFGKLLPAWVKIEGVKAINQQLLLETGSR